MIYKFIRRLGGKKRQELLAINLVARTKLSFVGNVHLFETCALENIKCACIATATALVLSSRLAGRSYKVENQLLRNFTLFATLSRLSARD